MQKCSNIDLSSLVVKFKNPDDGRRIEKKTSVSRVAPFFGVAVCFGFLPVSGMSTTSTVVAAHTSLFYVVYMGSLSPSSQESFDYSLDCCWY
jgi:hypothetical protein